MNIRAKLLVSAIALTISAPAIADDRIKLMPGIELQIGQPEERAPDLSEPSKVRKPKREFTRDRDRDVPREDDAVIENVQADMPSAGQIQRSLEGQPRMKVRPQDRVTVREFKRRPELRRAAPSIDIQAINFAFGSADIPHSQYGKVEAIATALERMLDRRPNSKVLIEGHTDAVGSNNSNLQLSERRADSLKWTLVREFGIPRSALETVGYGEDYLLVQTSNENWRNRRVTLRRIDEFLR